MNTTNLFVELLVIGLGPLILLWVLAALVIGPSATDGLIILVSESPLAVIIPALGVTYVLGIVADRLADRVYAAGMARRVRHRYFDSDDAYHHARRTIVVHAEAMYRIRQYGRSRMRIARGWALNIVLLFIPSTLLALRAFDTVSVLLLVAVMLVVWLGAVFSWHSIMHSEYEKIREGAAFVRGELERGLLPAGDDDS